MPALNKDWHMLANAFRGKRVWMPKSLALYAHAPSSFVLSFWSNIFSHVIQANYDNTEV